MKRHNKGKKTRTADRRSRNVRGGDRYAQNRVLVPFNLGDTPEILLDLPDLHPSHETHWGEGDICTRCWTSKDHPDATLPCKERSGICLNCTHYLKPEDYAEAACPYCGVA